MSTIVDGKKLSQELQKEMTEFLSRKNKKPSLHIIYVGSDPVIDNFVKYKQRYGKEIGAEVVVHNISEDIEEDELIDYIQKQHEFADGIIVQLPLPEYLDRNKILDSVSSEKDVDVLAEGTRERFIKKNTEFFPPVTGAIAYIAHIHGVGFAKANILVVGNGLLVGHPCVLWLEREKYNYTLVDKSTDLYVVHQLMNESDIIISGAGQPHMIKDFFVKEGVSLFDAGTSESGKKILGDVDPDAYKKAQLVTPVPGGIGPLTIAVLYYNLLHASYSDYDRNINAISR